MRASITTRRFDRPKHGVLSGGGEAGRSRALEPGRDDQTSRRTWRRVTGGGSGCRGVRRLQAGSADRPEPRAHARSSPAARQRTHMLTMLRRSGVSGRGVCLDGLLPEGSRRGGGAGARASERVGAAARTARGWAVRSSKRRPPGWATANMGAPDHRKEWPSGGASARMAPVWGPPPGLGEPGLAVLRLR
jgi:hypothetical protein